jgi:ABC-type multidrug transport system fused ATPase/permease subunit
VKNPLISRRFDGELKRAFRLLDKRDRRKLLLVTLVQVLFGFLDLLGVAVIGMVTAIAIRGIKSQGPGDKVSSILDFLGIEDFSLRSQVVFLGIAAVLILSSKTVFSVVFLRKTLFYLSRKSASISSDLISKLLAQPLSFISLESQQQRLFSVTTGVSNLTVGVLSNIVLIVSDISLLLVLLLGLFVVDPVVCISTLIVFGSVGVILYLLLHSRAARFGLENAKVSIYSSQKMIEAFSSYRELSARGGREFYANQISRQRYQLATFDAELKFLPNISKYVTELTVVIGITGIAAFQFSRSDNNHAIAVLSVFIAASTRIAPAVMRLQQSAITVKSYLASSKPTLDLADDLLQTEKLSRNENHVSIEHHGFTPQIEIKKLSFRYNSENDKVINNLNLIINPGSFTAFVGPSGGGKSTLIDLMLGVCLPDEGVIQISQRLPREALRTWPGAVGYVPQNVFVSNASIRENICLGFNPSEINDELVWNALEQAELSDFVRELDGQLDFLISDNGSNLSGGQSQRLGIARALVTKPKLLILDEATSALDADTEKRISNSISNLIGETTIVVVAHRLSTVRFADKIYYIDQGVVRGEGTFEEVKELNPDFKLQAEHMGL